MTEKKRFTLTNPKNAFQEMKCGINDMYKTLTFNEVVELLNKLHEENQQLKKDIDELDKKSDELHDEKIRLIRENTRLKKKLKEHNDMLEWHQGGW